MHYYAEHDLVPREIDLPILCDTVMINKNLHMMQVAEVLNIDIDLLRDINPQYRTDVIPGKSRPYPLKLPVKYTTQFIDLEDSIYAYKDTIYFNPKVALIIPTKGKNNWTYVPPAPSKDKTAVYYTVKTGDNLGFISEWYNVRIADLKYWNNVRGNMIRAGQKLIIYVPKSKLSRYKKVNTMSFAQKQKSIGATVTKNPEQENTTTTETTYTGKYSYYTVRQGDNPWLIAKKYPGVSAQNIIDINNISDTKGIKPGQKLKIPKY